MTPPAAPVPALHRGDPLDVPLVDDHLLTRLLLPRLVGSIRWAFPRVHADWTQDWTAAGAVAVAAADPSRRNDDGAASPHPPHPPPPWKDALVWKRVLEAALRTCLLVGSCRRVLREGGGGGGGVRVTTPAMHNLGVFLRPVVASDRRRDGSPGGRRGGGIVRAYGKVAALVVATVVLPALYEELKRRRRRQLEEGERARRLEEIRREVSDAFSFVGADERRRQQQQWQQQQQPQQQRQQPSRQSPRDIVRRRGQERKSRLGTLAADAILGMGDIFLPPLRLFQYLSYLWGMPGCSLHSGRSSCCHTPDLGMALAGWEYGAVDGPGGDDGGGGLRHRRHANFQYAHRRLLVEEALRTASAVLPPRTGGTLWEGGDGGGGTSAAGTVPRGGGNRVVDDGRGTRNGSDVGGVDGAGRRPGAGGDNGMTRPRGSGGRVRRRFLSFVGLGGEDRDEPAANAEGRDGDRCRSPLACSLCGTERPTVPYVASCGHTYCYLCLRAAVTDDLGFRCVDCGRAITSSGRPKCYGDGRRVGSRRSRK